MRFLLSHNYNIPATLAPALTVDAFCAAFATQLGQHLAVPCTVLPIAHPHWRCEVIVEAAPIAVGEALVAALSQSRSQQLGRPIAYSILALGGLKTTPATSPEPTALQPGEWGVDVVETPDTQEFLTNLGWDKLIAGRSADAMFQVVG
jgi:Protein of unknown function (DUF2656)